MRTTRPRPATSARCPRPRSSPASPTRAASTRCQEAEDDVVPADLGPETNPAVEESPDPLKKILQEGEDTDTAATKSSDGPDDDASTDQESPA